jgi:hypothetical protein
MALADEPSDASYVPIRGRDVKKGLTGCEACGHDFAKADSARPGPSEGR